MSDSENRARRPSPPEATRFKPGQSGNPGGRPRRLISEELRRLIDERVPNDPEGRTYARVLAQALLHSALKGKIEAVREVLDRVEGKVPHPIAAVVESSFSNLTREQMEERVVELLHAARERARLAKEGEPTVAEGALPALPEPGTPEV